MKVVEPRPALVPLTLGGEEILFRSLSGVATEVVARAGKTSFREAALFTHKGLSGPAILQISSYGDRASRSGSTSCPTGDRTGCWPPSARGRGSTSTRCGRGAAGAAGGDLWPRRSACGANSPTRRTAGSREIGRRLGNWQFSPNGTEGFAKAEVTAGGISTADLSSQTMEARKVPGLYAIGEGVDVTGWLGGYNFQWAWASGWAAGQAI
jgi:predicted flavoprotein YhiN